MRVKLHRSLPSTVSLAGERVFRFALLFFFFLLDVEMGAGGRAGACCGHNRLGKGSGKDIDGFLCSLKTLTQWHWGFLLWMEMEARLGRVKSDGDGITCREGEIPFTMLALFRFLFLVWGFVTLVCHVFLFRLIHE